MIKTNYRATHSSTLKILVLLNEEASPKSLHDSKHTTFWKRQKYEDRETISGGGG